MKELVKVNGVAQTTSPTYEDKKDIHSLPSPVLIQGKEFPNTKYTGKNFDTSIDASSLYLHRAPSEEEEGDDCAVGVDNCSQCTRSMSIADSKIEVDSDKEEEHLPAGQHLLVDIKHVDSSFLDSEKELAEAMVAVVNESALTLLSYHCHHLLPSGVSCVGVLLESHISFHTWPSEGVITLDLFTCGSGKLIPVLPLIKKLFAIPDRKSAVPVVPEVRWSHKLRGFRAGGKSEAFLDDLGSDVSTLNSETRERITSVQTKFQSIDIYDFTEKGDPTNRLVYLDGILQSTREGNEAYHEALVQPAMFAHPDPKRVAIIGGGEGATLRQVLKHKSIEKVKMIEIDGEMVDVSRKFLPDWNDCSDIVGSADWCGDDSRADLYYEDAFAWFIKRFSDDEKIDSEEFNEAKFDVVIMDALDPQDDVPFADFLYTNDNFFKTLYNSLTDDGLMVLQLGMAAESHDPPEDHSKQHKRAYLIGALSRIGFDSIHVYDEGHCGFSSPWSFLVAMKSYNSRAYWFRNSAEINLDIQRRMLETYSKKGALKYFDGATMKQYQVPHKAFENVYCKKDPMPASCFAGQKREKVKDVKMSELEVKMSGVGEYSGRGLFTNVDIEKGSSIGKRERAKSVHFPPSTVRLILLMNNELDDEVEEAELYMDGYGWQSLDKGDLEYYVDSTLLTFSNHGCNGTINIESRKEIDTSNDLYDPHFDRHMRHLVNDVEYATRFIAAGEEVLCDYANLAEAHEKDYRESIERMCNQEEVGDVTRWESKE